MHANNRVSSIHRHLLDQGAEQRLRAALRAQAPSEPWVDAQFEEVEAVDERHRRFVRRRLISGVFPPGGDDTKMIRCPICGILTPPSGMEGGVCLDHVSHAHWGPSPSALAFRACEFYVCKPPELELPSESIEDLQNEIEAANKSAAQSVGKKA